MFVRGASAYVLSMALLTATAYAHGGVRVDKDRCVLKIGPDTMHFTGYQPLDTREEFCEDIPAVGPTIIVLDYEEPELREMTAEIRVIKDDGAHAGITGMPGILSDVELSSGNLNSVTEEYLAPKRYPTGTINFAHTFTSAGKFIGIVTMKNSHGQIYVSQFPFSVGRSWVKSAPLYGLLIVVVSGSFLLYWKFGDHKNVIPPKRSG
jgi:hypothetical protein